MKKYEIDIDKLNFSHSPSEKLPEVGQKVVALVVKEMIYQGECDDNGSLWEEESNGFRAIMLWSELPK